MQCQSCTLLAANATVTGARVPVKIRLAAAPIRFYTHTHACTPQHITSQSHAQTSVHNYMRREHSKCRSVGEYLLLILIIITHARRGLSAVRLLDGHDIARTVLMNTRINATTRLYCAHVLAHACVGDLNVLYTSAQRRSRNKPFD